MSENTIKSNVFYVTICQYPEEALPNAYRVRPYVNEIIVVHNYPVIAQVKAEFDELNATLHYVDWKEDFSFKRTQYIRKTGEIIKEHPEKGYTKDNTWMLVSDIDEFPSFPLLQNLQNLLAKAEIEKSTICTINAHDYLIKGEGTANPFTFIPRPLEELDDGEIISHSISNYHKELLVKYQDKLEYTGKVHHTLRGTGLRMMQAPKDYYYDHIKTDADLHSHGCRNWFIGGGGVQEFSAKWKTLRGITDKYGLDTWEKMEKAMKIGNIHSDILQFIIDHKDDNDRHTDSELRSFYSYYKMLHENELKGVVQTVKTVVTEKGIIEPLPKQKVRIVDNGIHEPLYIYEESNKDIKEDKLYYDPKWKKDYGSVQPKSSDKLIDTSKPLYNNPQKVTGDYIKDMSYHFQEAKISSDSSDSSDLYVNPKISISSPKMEKIIKLDNEIDKINGTESEDEIREFVEDTYNQVLGRCGDPGGVKGYVELIKNKKITKNNLADIFRKSDEYIEKGLET